MDSRPWGLIDISRAAEAGSPDRGVARAATQQHGVVTSAQMRYLGLSPDAIAHRVKQGRLHPVHRGVYLVGHEATPMLARFAAGVLACGPGSCISHRSAAAIWRLLPFIADLIHVLRLGSSRRHRRGIMSHRTRRLERWEIRRVQRIPIVCPARTVVDLAETEPFEQVERALNQGRIRKAFTEDEFRIAVERAEGRSTAGGVTALLERELGSGFSRSVAEDLLSQYIREARLPSPKRNFRLHGNELDFYWPELGLDVEIDGVAWHSTRDRVNRDHERDARLVAAGIQILRFTWDQLQRKPETVARLAAALAIAGERRRR